MVAVHVGCPPGLEHREWVSPADKLRLSVTDACNYTCVFCHNEGNIPTRLSSVTPPSPSTLSLYARCAVESGVRSIKITGGEPLTYRYGDISFEQLVPILSEGTQGRAILSLTTNGQLLTSVAPLLDPDQLSHITVSIHTFDRRTFGQLISSSGSPAAQLRGVKSALKHGHTVKVNTVVLPESVAEVSSLSTRLFEQGVHTLRLYRALWSPFATGGTKSNRVSDDTLIDLALEICGLSNEPTIKQHAQLFLSGALGTRESTLRFKGKRGVVEIDRMPETIDSSNQEGDYALRIGADHCLRTRLFSTPIQLVDDDGKPKNSTSIIALLSQARAQLSRDAR